MQYFSVCVVIDLAQVKRGLISIIKTSYKSVLRVVERLKVDFMLIEGRP